MLLVGWIIVILFTTIYQVISWKVAKCYNQSCKIDQMFHPEKE